MKHNNFIIHHFPELESTNKTALSQASAKKIFDHEIILADKQSDGKGRKNRSWNSPVGNLYFSIILQPKISPEKISQISFVAAVAMQSALEKLTKNINLKWPNDILIDNKKCAGILLESQFNQKTCEFVILGIGLNITSNPDNTIFPATNLQRHDVAILPLEFLKIFLDNFEKTYQSWLNFGFSTIRNLWLKNAFKLQKEITISLDNKEINGIFVDIDNDGNLLLQTQNKLEKISVGDVS